MKVLGLDGCKGGWVGIVTDPEFAAPRVVGGGDLAMLIAASGAAHAVIDIPLGLSETGPRACDAAARGVLRRKGSSVFPVPIRSAVAAEDYASACKISLRATGKAFSIQAWGIVPKIREANDVARTCRISLREGHPELSFTLANDDQPLESKKSARGLFQRLKLLARLGLQPDKLDLTGLPDGAAPDDVLDAAIMAWSAGRLATGKAALFPPTPTPTCDAFGLPMQMVA